jgi:hypothetical protein
MPRLYKTKIWQLQIPDAWAVRDDPEQQLLTFFRPDGVGLLTVFTTDESVQGQNGQGEDFRSKGLLAASLLPSFLRRWLPVRAALTCWPLLPLPGSRPAAEYYEPIRLPEGQAALLVVAPPFLLGPRS